MPRTSTNPRTIKRQAAMRRQAHFLIPSILAYIFKAYAGEATVAELADFYPVCLEGKTRGSRRKLIHLALTMAVESGQCVRTGYYTYSVLPYAKPWNPEIRYTIEGQPSPHNAQPKEEEDDIPLFPPS